MISIIHYLHAAFSGVCGSVCIFWRSGKTLLAGLQVLEIVRSQTLILICALLLSGLSSETHTVDVVLSSPFLQPRRAESASTVMSCCFFCVIQSRLCDCKATKSVFDSCISSEEQVALGSFRAFCTVISCLWSQDSTAGDRQAATTVQSVFVYIINCTTLKSW